MDEEEDEQNEEELECFDDFTVASSWERLIADIEAICRNWLADGPDNLKEKGAECLGSKRNIYSVKCELKYGVKLYCMEYYFEASISGKAAQWDDDMHNIQLSFGVTEFLVISPLSASGVILDAPESSKLLSAVAIALSNCGSNWPAFVPVHDPSRKAYIGIQNLGTNFTKRFDADRIGSQVPIRLMHLEGLYELFVSKFTLSSMDFSTSFFKVDFTMKLTYITPPNDTDDDIESEEPEKPRGDIEGLNHIKSQWDDDCPWAEWYSAEDPVNGFELTAIWSNRIFEGSLEMAELENASSFDAEKWFIHPILSPNMIDDSVGKMIGFSSQLRLLIIALDKSFEAQFLEDFVSVENSTSDNSKSGISVPPPTVLDRVLKELFHEGSQSSNYSGLAHKNSRAIKGAPLNSLFAQFCLHTLWYGNCNIRAIAALWIEFVREVRWCWEESQSLPRMPTDSGIDLTTCLVHQKLQMLAICIGKKKLLERELHSGSESKVHAPDDSKVSSPYSRNQSQDPIHEPLVDKCVSSLGLNGQRDTKENFKGFGMDPAYPSATADLQPINNVRKGSARALESKLLNSFQKMHAPYTQDAPLMTEDMHEERLRAVEAFGDAFSFPGQLERDILSSDMSAFKAANPDAAFEDFIRWHSPSDWETDETEDRSGDKWPPCGRLSQRMSEHGNSWRQIWNESPAVPSSEQKPLFDPIREGEKVLHYLETLRPHQLLEQMVCTAFRASADTLNQTHYGDIKLMKAKVSQLYSTLASALRPLQGNNLPEKAEFIGDLQHTCRVFEHIEKLLIFAASIHSKLLDAPRLSVVVFNDVFNFYLPKMGTTSASICYNKEYKTKQSVQTRERDAVASLFPPPTANQSWRKVLSMGNLLNGHEPVLREIIFTVRDQVSDNHYGNNNPLNFDGEIETHRIGKLGFIIKFFHLLHLIGASRYKSDLKTRQINLHGWIYTDCEATIVPSSKWLSLVI
ncbi:rab3 GTPase-activating protein catalytic subunit isoform X1 [Iris pallida]|uniref:Rab3 GTPase-activating protein catalytic subunit n=1 Tax=Iris pallida TaxID=29817 RepID=A0AAX6H4L5_IRIPA|nr:rab3 GTPase-activating protein catalytic subunit isoform X1 [Iris pallida]